MHKQKVKFLAIITLISVAFNKCKEAPSTSGYPRMIGDIAFDPEIDDPDFLLCRSENYTVQYYAYTNHEGDYPYINEKRELEEIFNKKYDPQMAAKESGLIRIRFVVNCKGEADRYRIISMDNNYKPKKFDKSITDQLLTITKSDLRWKSFDTEKLKRDYYMYLIFKIDNGNIIEIMP